MSADQERTEARLDELHAMFQAIRHNHSSAVVSELEGQLDRQADTVTQLQNQMTGMATQISVNHHKSDVTTMISTHPMCSASIPDWQVCMTMNSISSSVIDYAFDPSLRHRPI